MTVVATQEAFPVEKPAIEERLLKDLTLMVVGVGRQDLPSALLGAVQTVWFEGVADGQVLFSDQSGAVFQVIEAPTMAFAVLAEPGTSADVDTLFKWLQRHGVVQLPSVVGWSRGQENEAISSILALVAEHV